MIVFFQTNTGYIAVQSNHALSQEDLDKYTWLFSGATPVKEQEISGTFIGPRREMITPWSTNAVEITLNMGLTGASRIEEFFTTCEEPKYDPMLQRLYKGLDQDIFTIEKKPDPIVFIEDIEVYNQQEGLALNAEEIMYLKGISEKLNRSLTDSEVFGFSQVNSEHCRHKIFGGTFIIDGKEMPSSLFEMIKQTSKMNPNDLVSAYKDNVAFNQGPIVEQFAPASGDKADFFVIKDIETVISLKAETHNFPTTVEPFNGAATGTGGEIRDRLGGGKASLPIAGTAVYMTAYPRTENGREWEEKIAPRPWIYQTPEQILIKASNGASDFGNKFGQPLICGSLLTFEHEENNQKLGYDKVIMLAGGVGFGAKRDSLKGEPKIGEKVVVLGGDNYRIGMGGGAVSSVDTGQFDNKIELNAVQRANPEMQKRVSNVIRTLAESTDNPIVSIHDHGAGGHLNCLSELVETTGGKIDVEKLPIGDKTLSAKEIIGNESQERMGLLIDEKEIEKVRRIAERERSPMYVVGETTGDMKFVFEQADGQKPIDLRLDYMIGKPPRTYMKDETVERSFEKVTYSENLLSEYVEQVLRLEAVACKDWLTNKVDRSVTGKIARQQTAGEIQLPVCDLGAVSLDYRGKAGIATSIGHAPQAALIDPAAGSVLSIAEALTNIVWAPLAKQLESISLSANWMWPCKNKGEDARLYKAVEACSQFAIDLGINIPTGKDSLSMTQKYGDEKILSPGTVIISAGAEVSDIKKIVTPVLQNKKDSFLYYIDFSSMSYELGGSAFAQTQSKLAEKAPTVASSEQFKNAFLAIQTLIDQELVLAGHDISAGGMITTLLEMNFPNMTGGVQLDLDVLEETDLVKLLFAENPGVVIQIAEKEAVEKVLNAMGVKFAMIGTPCEERHLIFTKAGASYQFGIDYLRDVWYSASYLLDRKQSGEACAQARFENYKKQSLQFTFPTDFTGKLEQYELSVDRREKTGVRAAIIREKGVNGDREMAYSLYLAGFDVKDIHMSDLMSGRETLDDVQMVVFCGGFSNSDVLGSAKGWAGGFLYNENAKKAIERFYARKDTLSLGICNGCQLMMELGLIYPSHSEKPTMQHNESHKFESSYLNVEIPNNRSIMLRSLAGTQLGVWVAHAEGRFNLPYGEERYQIAAKYLYSAYPANPNGSDYSAAAVCSEDGRHLAMMPHLERAIFPWQCAEYPTEHKKDDVTPWLEAFVNARKWVEQQ